MSGENALKSRRLLKYVIFALVLVALAAIYYFLDPTGYRWMPKCPVKMFLGVDCPGCGSQRMIHSLLHGDFQGAWKANAFLLFAIPYIVLLIIADIFRYRLKTLFDLLYSPASIIFVAISIFSWGILRNF